MRIKKCLLTITLVAALAAFTVLVAAPAVADEISGAAGSETWYVAEGSTAITPTGEFQTFVSVMNDNLDDVDLDVQFQTPGGPVNVPTMSLEAESTMNINVADYVPNNWSVSTRITASEDVMAERFMLFKTSAAGQAENFQWAHGSLGVTEPNDFWYLAEGSTGRDNTGYFETWILVQNPTATDAVIDMQFQTITGMKQGPQSETIKAGERKSYNVADYVPNTWGVSTSVSTRDGAQVVCERAMYWSTWVTERQSAHASVGTTATGTNWFLAEGSTGRTPWNPNSPDPSAGNFESWVLVQNPTLINAKIDISFQTPTGEVLGPQGFEVDAGERWTFRVADWVPNQWSVSTAVTCTTGKVIAERAMYWNLPQAATSQSDPNQWKRYCAHDSIGAMNDFQTWEVSGITLPDNGWEAWILVQNPTNQDQEVAITYYSGGPTDAGRVEGPVMTIPAFSRHSFSVNDTFAKDVGAIGAVVNVTDPADPGIVVEHSNYWGFGQGTDPQGYRQIAWDSIGHAELP